MNYITLQTKLTIPTKHGARFIELTGRFGRLVVLAYAGVRNKRVFWKCQCDCGETAYAHTNALRSGNTQSCGCLVRELRAANQLTHGRTNTPEYHAYVNAKARCENPLNTNFHRYGGRGIKFLFMSFTEFFAEVGERPTEKHSIDRIDTDGHYESGNLRWATPTQQSRNTRRNRYITIGSVTKCVAEWAKDSPAPTGIYRRLDGGWCDVCAVTAAKRAVCVHMPVDKAIKTAKRSVTV